MELFKQRNALVIIGMHRSGTSALSGIFSLLDFCLGSAVIPPMDENPKGFFENISLNQFNDRLLATVGSSWDETCLLRNEVLKAASLSATRVELKNIILDQFGDKDPFVIKDPRLSILWPFYEIVFNELNIHPCFIICFRNPSEVAESLAKRNGFNDEKSILIWMDHLIKAEVNTRIYPRCFLWFNDLIQNPIQIIQLILNDFYGKTVTLPDVDLQIMTFVEKELKHHNLPIILARHHFIPEISRLYHELLNGRIGHDDSIDLQAMDEIRNSFYGKLFFFNGQQRIQPL